MTCPSHLNRDCVFSLNKAHKITAVGKDPLEEKELKKRNTFQNSDLRWEFFLVDDCK